jgi:hypothetical protein
VILFQVTLTNKLFHAGPINKRRDSTTIYVSCLITMAILRKVKSFLKRRLSSVSRKIIWQADNDSYDILHYGTVAAAIETARYVEEHALTARIFSDKFSLLTFCTQLAASSLPSDLQSSEELLFLEFGVHQGTTVNHIAKEIPHAKVYGFDVFTGLPENWRPGFEQGFFALDRLPLVRDNVVLIEGIFSKSLPSFVDQRPKGIVGMVHIDCDLYSSTRDVFSALGPMIRPGTVVCFDEYWNYFGWRQHEFKAWREWTLEHGIHYEYLGFVPSHQQVAIRVISIS